jgi:hypothetical protein
LIVFFTSSARAQYSGTMLRDTVTFAGTQSATIEIAVAGPRLANTATVLSFDFGPDGASSPPTGLVVPANVGFTVSSGSYSKVFHLTGNDATQPFPNKQVDFSRPDPANKPNLFSLSVIHLAGIDVGMSERWKLTIDNLPPAGLRANGSVTQGEFVRLSPVGVAEAPVIRIVPEPLAPGTAKRFAIAASAGFDVSQVGPAQVSVDPRDGISNIKISGATPTGLTVTFDLARCTPGGNRTLTIAAGGASASASFVVTPPPPPLRLSLSSVRTGTSVPMTVFSSECFDMSWISHDAVKFIPADGISAFTVSLATSRSFLLSFSVANNAPPGERTVSVTIANNTAAASFTVVPAGAQVCNAPRHCCAGPVNACIDCRVEQCPAVK